MLPYTIKYPPRIVSFQCMRVRVQSTQNNNNNKNINMLQKSFYLNESADSLDADIYTSLYIYIWKVPSQPTNTCIRSIPGPKIVNITYDIQFKKKKKKNHENDCIFGTT